MAIRLSGHLLETFFETCQAQEGEQRQSTTNLVQQKIPGVGRRRRRRRGGRPVHPCRQKMAAWLARVARLARRRFRRLVPRQQRPLGLGVHLIKVDRWRPGCLPRVSSRWCEKNARQLRVLWSWFFFIIVAADYADDTWSPNLIRGLIILGIFFWSGLGIIFGFLLLCFPAFPASLLFCFSASPASRLFCFFAFLLLLLLCFSAFLLFCFSCFFASLLFLLFLLLCFSAFPASLPFSCFAFVRFLFLCFSAFLLLCFFFALPALNTWFSCKMHFAQYLHPWVSHDQPSLEN